MSESVSYTLYSVKKCLTDSLSVLFEVYLPGRRVLRRGVWSKFDAQSAERARARARAMEAGASGRMAPFLNWMSDG